MSRLKGIVLAILYPGILIGALALLWLLRARGVAPWLSVSLPVALTVVSRSVAGRLWPYRAEWQPPTRTLLNDLLHYLLSTGATSGLLHAVCFGLLVQAGGALAGLLAGAPWPASWPLPIQIALGLVLKDLGFYVVHRWMHESALGWRLHALHHSSTELHTLAAGRTHPLNVILTYLVPLAPVVVLGAGPEVLAFLAVATGVNGMLQHANVDFRHGPLNLFFATADMHRRHHSADVADSSSNYGNVFLVWDHLSGTFGRPRGRELSAGVVGVRFPRGFLAQLAVPFVYRRLEERR
jgi:sterol desaturase/sphingolipid hydroxylase (fatty acid hydroxylase superfamily)